MILNDEHVLRAIELRLKTVRIRGTLCYVIDPETIHNAMKYFDVWNDGSYLSNPYAYLDKWLFYNMTPDTFRIFVEYNLHWAPSYTKDELALIYEYAPKFGYSITRHKNKVTFRRTP